MNVFRKTRRLLFENSRNYLKQVIGPAKGQPTHAHKHTHINIQCSSSAASTTTNIIIIFTKLSKVHCCWQQYQKKKRILPNPWEYFVSFFLLLLHHQNSVSKWSFYFGSLRASLPFQFFFLFCYFILFSVMCSCSYSVLSWARDNKRKYFSK